MSTSHSIESLVYHYQKNIHIYQAKRQFLRFLVSALILIHITLFLAPIEPFWWCFSVVLILCLLLVFGYQWHQHKLSPANVVRLLEHHGNLQQQLVSYWSLRQKQHPWKSLLGLRLGQELKKQPPVVPLSSLAPLLTTLVILLVAFAVYLPWQKLFFMKQLAPGERSLVQFSGAQLQKMAKQSQDLPSSLQKQLVEVGQQWQKGNKNKQQIQQQLSSMLHKTQKQYTMSKQQQSYQKQLLDALELPETSSGKQVAQELSKLPPEQQQKLQDFLQQHASPSSSWQQISQALGREDYQQIAQRWEQMRAASEQVERKQSQLKKIRSLMGRLGEKLQTATAPSALSETEQGEGGGFPSLPRNSSWPKQAFSSNKSVVAIEIKKPQKTLKEAWLPEYQPVIQRYFSSQQEEK